MNEVELSGVILGYLVAGAKILELVRDWRGGAPELRLLRDAIDSQRRQWDRITDELSDQSKSLQALVGLMAPKDSTQ